MKVLLHPMDRAVGKGTWRRVKYDNSMMIRRFQRPNWKMTEEMGRGGANIAGPRATWNNTGKEGQAKIKWAGAGEMAQ